MGILALLRRVYGKQIGMVDLQTMQRVFEELHDFVSSEPELLAFAPATAELRDQARAVNEGNLAVPTLGTPSPERIATRELAEKLVAILSQMPSLDEDEQPALKWAVATLQGNLVQGIVHAIFVSYPDVVPRRTTGS